MSFLQRINTSSICILCVMVLGAGSWLSCKKRGEPMMQLLESSVTGIDFVNELKDSDTLNILDYLYYYNGAGSAVGDINNDGLADIYLVSNQGPNKLYLNQGEFRFEDITEKAGVAGSGNWNTGVAMADVNGDGFLDIYLMTVGGYRQLRGKNQLYINQKNGTFREEAAAWGLDHVGFSTHAAFFDYDKDGDLDCYLLNHSVHSTESYGDSSYRSKVSASSGDKLYRNDGSRMTDVTRESGIYSSPLGYGLGVAIGDLNNDGWDDIYVSNDFHENDYYYINNGNGTFRENVRGAFGHTSWFSMGNDIADLNNDGWLDILSTDMLPDDEKVLKSSNSDEPLDVYELKMSFGYYNQYSRNALQLNTGGGKHFSDVALMSGVAATDWTWGVLGADFNLDGRKDLFFHNGIVRRLNDLDYIKYYADESISSTLRGSRVIDREVIEQMPSGKVHNYLYFGTDSLFFEDRSVQEGMDTPSFSTGASYGDFDNDGDLDIVTNNINDPAWIFRNMTMERKMADKPVHSLRVAFRSETGNRFGLGCKVMVQTGQQAQYQQLYTSRGFMSSSEPVLTFGVTDSVVNRIVVEWPDGRRQVLQSVVADTLLTFRHEDAREGLPSAWPSAATEPGKTWKDISEEVSVGWLHRENTSFVDFNREWLIPHEQSTLGPALAIGDVDGDGLEDIFFGGAKNQSGSVFRQQPDGRLVLMKQEALQLDSSYEDVDAVWWDADGDRDLDLYVASGGNEYFGKMKELQDRLYLNDGKGFLQRSTQLPVLAENKSVVRLADWDLDGDTDLFVGGRSNSEQYGRAPKSFLLRNEGGGRMVDVTEQLAPELREAGRVADAAFADMDEDKRPDLILAGEWMPLTIMYNRLNRWEKLGAGHSGNLTGWWQSMYVRDFDGDGDADIMLGNYGLNSKLKASPEQPLRMYVFDYDNNGKEELILAYSKNRKYYTFLGKEELEKQIPAIRKRFLKYRDFAGQDVRTIFGEALRSATVLEAQTLAHHTVWNDGQGNFRWQRLPFSTQVSPLFAWNELDMGNGQKAVVGAGNFFGVLPYEGRYDAGVGVVLQPHANGWLQQRPYQSGFMIHGEVRKMSWWNRGGTQVLVVARNNSSPVFLQAP